MSTRNWFSFFSFGPPFSDLWHEPEQSDSFSFLLAEYARCSDGSSQRKKMNLAKTLVPVGFAGLQTTSGVLKRYQKTGFWAQNEKRANCQEHLL